MRKRNELNKKRNLLRKSTVFVSIQNSIRLSVYFDFIQTYLLLRIPTIYSSSRKVLMRKRIHYTSSKSCKWFDVHKLCVFFSSSSRSLSESGQECWFDIDPAYAVILVRFQHVSQTKIDTFFIASFFFDSNFHFTIFAPDNLFKGIPWLKRVASCADKERKLHVERDQSNEKKTFEKIVWKLVLQITFVVKYANTFELSRAHPLANDSSWFLCVVRRSSAREIVYI